jgi:hypothetical protein
MEPYVDVSSGIGVYKRCLFNLTIFYLVNRL